MTTDVTERVLRLGRAGSLSGVLTLPAQAPPGKPGVLLLNAGMVHRVGPGRLYVKLARALATDGFPVLRFDFSGFGDSVVRQDGIPFEQSAVEETRTSMDALARLGGCRTFGLIGLCSGAEIAFKTACVDSRVTGAVLMNPPRYHDEPDARVLAEVARHRATDYYWRVARRKRRSWVRLLSGRSRYAAVLHAMRAKMRDQLAAVRNGARRQNGDAAAFDLLRRRAARLLLVFTVGDLGWKYLHAVLGPRVERWVDAPDSPRVELLENTDHTMTLLSSQERVIRLSLGWMDLLPPAAGALSGSDDVTSDAR